MQLLNSTAGAAEFNGMQPGTPVECVVLRTPPGFDIRLFAALSSGEQTMPQYSSQLSSIIVTIIAESDPRMFVVDVKYAGRIF